VQIGGAGLGLALRLRKRMLFLKKFLNIMPAIHFRMGVADKHPHIFVSRFVESSLVLTAVREYVKVVNRTGHFGWLIVRGGDHLACR
jgi:hypothetical protein